MEEQTIILDNTEISMKDFREAESNPNTILKEISANIYKTLQKMEG